MKKWYALILTTGFIISHAFAAIPAVNQYITEKRPIAPEPTAQQYTISESDVTTVTQPAFGYYTQLNTANPKELFSIPPFPHTNQLPKIGKWMIAVEARKKTVTYVPAHWLNYPSAEGKYIIEPINYIFIVHEPNAAAANKRIQQTLVASGFNDTWSGEKYHSDNYHAFIGDQRVSQLKRADGVFLTFSNSFWENQNDHLRVLGPYKTTLNNQTVFMYVTSVSEESVWDNKPYAGHYYVSFTHARSNLAQALIKHGHATYYVISNNILNTAKETTEDHDGKLFLTIIN